MVERKRNSALAIVLLMSSLLFVACSCGSEELEHSVDRVTIEAEVPTPIDLPEDLVEEPPTVLIPLLVRNKAHVLPLFLSYLERQDYPKDRIALWIRSDHNSDKSIEILQLWLEHVSARYHSVDAVFDDVSQRHQNESTRFDWPTARFRHLIMLKESAYAYGLKIWADFIFFLDADVLLTEPKTLKHLVGLRLPVVAPMLYSEGLYSNFWCGMTTDYYYRRTDEYKKIYESEKVGSFAVPMIHSAVLVHLNYQGARYLTFDRERLVERLENDAEWAASNGRQCRMYYGPLDDIIIFAVSANCSNIPLFINNQLGFGYILQPLDSNDDLARDQQQLMNVRVNMVHDLGSVPPVDEFFSKYIAAPKKHKLDLDSIFMINLKRRPERREKMERVFNELGLHVEYFEAVDGQELDADSLKRMDIQFMPGYEDPYHGRHMTMGEVGCFLSHYRIWTRMVREGLNEVLVLEDDIRFEPYFQQNAESVVQQARNEVKYDLIYFGRKRLQDEKEPPVNGTENLVHVGYSYWTLGYVISLKGARKLLAAKPLYNLLPVDEFLPIMFDRHPNKTWSELFKYRNLLAYSSSPLLLYPTHYTGESGYISDTEDSQITLTDSTDSPPGKGDREFDWARSSEEEEPLSALHDEERASAGTAELGQNGIQFSGEELEHLLKLELKLNKDMREEL